MADAATLHQSVLLAEVVAELAPVDGGTYIDATCGLGGHTEAILEACGPTGRVLAIDRDPRALELARGRLARFGSRVTLVEGDFSELRTYAEASDHFPVQGVVADLGVSSIQLDDGARGFSFSRPGPLDMRMGPRVGETAADLLERVDLDGLTRMLRELGEIERPRSMAQAILRARDDGRLSDTAELAKVIAAAGGGGRPSAIHPATRAFQAIRIAVNRELDELERLLEVLPQLLVPGGRAAIISFHSLEDRRVKQAFRDPEPDPALAHLPIDAVKGPFVALTKRPIIPGDPEIARNPRARSAKLRVAERR